MSAVQCSAVQCTHLFQQDRLGALELLVQHRHLRLHQRVLRVGRDLIDRVQEARFGNIAQREKAALSDAIVTVLR
jgi:hypothetical protein